MLQIWLLGGATCIRKRHNFLVINRKSYDRCGRLAKVCIWKFQVSFFCTAASARYFDTYVCRLAATSASSTQSKLWQPEKVSPRLSGTFVGGGKRRRRGAGSWAKQPLSPAHDASSAQKGPAGLRGWPGRRGSKMMEKPHHYHQQRRRGPFSCLSIPNHRSLTQPPACWKINDVNVINSAIL